MTDIILKAEHLKKVFISGKKSMTAVDDVSFGLERGECLGIVGESGSGKSTIARMLTHLEPVTDGQIFLKGRTSPMPEGRLCVIFTRIYRWSFRCRWNRLTRDVRWVMELGKVSGIWG